MIRREFKERFYLLFVSLVLFLLPILIRFIKGNFTSPFLWSPYLVSGLTPHYNILYFMLIAGFSILLSLFSLTLIYYSLRNIDSNINERLLTIVLLMISPGFIYLYFVPSKHTIIFFLISLSFYLVTHKKNLFNYLGLISLVPILFFREMALVVGLFIFLYLFWFKKNVIFSLILLIISFFVYLFGEHNVLFKSGNIMIMLISDFGGFTGILLAILVLSVIGIFVNRSVKRVSLPIFIILIIIFLSTFDWHYLIYSLPIICFSAGRTIDLFLSSFWKINIIKKATLLVVLCTLLFSTVSFSTRVASKDPSPKLFESLQYLDSLENGVVLSSPENYFLIKYYGGKEGTLHYESNTNKSNQEYNIEYQNVFRTRSIKSFNNYINENNINYIFLTPEMKSDLWNNEQEGVYYLLNEYPQFNLIYNEEGYEIWAVESVKNE